MSGSGWHTPIPADLDLDGKKEIVMRHQVFSSAGAVLWSLQFSGSSILGAVLNMDADDTAEAMMNNSLGLHLRQHDGTPIAQYTRPGDHDMGPPCVADFDGDGLVEIGVPARIDHGQSSRRSAAIDLRSHRGTARTRRVRLRSSTSPVVVRSPDLEYKWIADDRSVHARVADAREPCAASLGTESA